MTPSKSLLEVLTLATSCQPPTNTGVDKQKIDELKKEGKKQRTILYAGLGVGVLLYALLILKLKK